MYIFTTYYVGLHGDLELLLIFGKDKSECLFHANNNVLVPLLAFGEDDLFCLTFAFVNSKSKLTRVIPFQTFNKQLQFRETWRTTYFSHIFGIAAVPFNVIWLGHLATNLHLFNTVRGF